MQRSFGGGMLLMGQPGQGQPTPDPFMGSIGMLNVLLEQKGLELQMPTPTGLKNIDVFKYDGYNENSQYAALVAVHQYPEGGTAEHLVIFPKRDSVDLADFKITEQYPVMPISLESAWKLADKVHAAMSEKSIVDMVKTVGVLPVGLQVGDTLILRAGQPEDTETGQNVAWIVGSSLKIVPGQRVLYAGNATPYNRHTVSRTAAVYIASNDGRSPQIREIDLTRYELASQPLLDKKGRKAFQQQVLSDQGAHIPFKRNLMGAIWHHVIHTLGLATSIVIAALVLAGIFGVPTAHAAADKPPIVLKPITLPEKQPTGFSYVYCKDKVCHDIYTNENIVIDNVDKDGYYGYVTDN